ncbi:hypothetical protein HYH03_017040 [Edaphochlamys debaryana]|uniref:Uncharacterized protein n=1 Tax=Edaphochlamys debaryana TaxID=47281 RepID=A0A835XQ78_9CHLO|nr:hypothetical protein HYH03_017040 [Edaphochlamys debaryana]|eukprot:KAG2484159.1 hypothetical protein HYH03_017040 [Edaphochlamys debaryana]
MATLGRVRVRCLLLAVVVLAASASTQGGDGAGTDEIILCTLVYAGPDAAIPDDITKVLTLAATSKAQCLDGPVSDILVAVNLTHTCVGDLVIKLASGDVTVTLFTFRAIYRPAYRFRNLAAEGHRPVAI